VLSVLRRGRALDGRLDRSNWSRPGREPGARAGSERARKEERERAPRGWEREREEREERERAKEKSDTLAVEGCVRQAVTLEPLP